MKLVNSTTAKKLLRELGLLSEKESLDKVILMQQIKTKLKLDMMNVLLNTLINNFS